MSKLSEPERQVGLSGNTPAIRDVDPNVGSMLARRRRRGANIYPALGQRLVFTGTGRSANACCFNAGPASPTFD